MIRDEILDSIQLPIGKNIHVDLITREKWLELTEVTKILLDIRKEGNNHTFHTHEIFINPPKESDYNTKIISRRGFFEDGSQFVELEFEELPVSLKSSETEIHFGKTPYKVDCSVEDNLLKFSVPLKFSEREIKVSLVKLKKQFDVESYVELSNSYCKVVQHKKNLRYSADNLNQEIFTISRKGVWEGRLKFSVLEPVGNKWNRVSFSSPLEYKLHSSGLEEFTFNYRRLREWFRAASDVITELNTSKTLRLDLEIICGSEEQGPIFQVKMPKFSSYPEPEGEFYTIEGEEFTKVLFKYDSLNYKNTSVLKLLVSKKISDSEKPTTISIQEIGEDTMLFLVQNSVIGDQIHDVEWNLTENDKVICSGEFSRPSISIKEIRDVKLLASKDRSMIHFPNDILEFTSPFLPTATKLECSIDFPYSKYPPHTKKIPFSFSEVGGNGKLDRKVIEFSDLFPISGLEHKWSKILEELEDDMIGILTISFPSRPGSSKSVPIYLETSSKPELYVLLRHLKNAEENEEKYDLPAELYRSVKEKFKHLDDEKAKISDSESDRVLLRNVFVYVLLVTLKKVVNYDWSVKNNFDWLRKYRLLQTKKLSYKEWELIRDSLKNNGLFLSSLFYNPRSLSDVFLEFMGEFVDTIWEPEYDDESLPSPVILMEWDIPDIPYPYTYKQIKDVWDELDN